MAKVKVLKEVVGINQETYKPVLGDDVYPITRSDLVIAPDGKSLDENFDEKISKKVVEIDSSRQASFNAAETSRQNTFNSKEAERDAANAAATNAAAQISELSYKVNGVKNIITDDAKALLETILKAAVYTSDQSDNIDEFLSGVTSYESLS